MRVYGQVIAFTLTLASVLATEASGAQKARSARTPVQCIAQPSSRLAVDRFAFALRAIPESELDRADLRRDINALAGEAATELARTLAVQGVDAFLEDQKYLEMSLGIAIPTHSWHWQRKVDRSLIERYLSEIVRPWRALGDRHPGARLSRQFEAALRAGKLDLQWMEGLYYGAAPEESRGIFQHASNSVSLKIAVPSAIVAPLAHELTHRFDDELRAARYSMDELYAAQISLPVDHASWSESQRALFGRYWFLTEYLRYHKELVPLYNACRVFTSLFEQGALNSPQKRDLAEYEGVIRGSETCARYAFRHNEALFGRVRPFWPKGSWQAELVDEYREGWLRVRIPERADGDVQ